MSVCGGLGSSCGASSFKCCSPLFCSYNFGTTFGTIVDVKMFMGNEALTLILLISIICLLALPLTSPFSINLALPVSIILELWFGQ